jgi:hypothetical protein
MFQFGGHAVEAVGKLADLVMGSHFHRSRTFSLSQESCFLGKEGEGAGYSPRDGCSAENNEEHGESQDDGALLQMLAEMAADQFRYGSGRLMELVNLEADGYAAEYAMAAVITGPVGDWGEGHDLAGTPHVGGVQVAAFPLPNQLGDPGVAGVDETGMVKVEGDTSTGYVSRG